MAANREEVIRRAATLYHSGLSCRAVGKELNVSAKTISRWANTSEVWQSEWEKLEAASRAARESMVLNNTELIEQSSSKLGRFSLANMEQALDVQKGIAQALKDMEIPTKIRSFDELASVVRTLKDLTAMVQTSWQGLCEALELEDFLKENQQPPTLVFEEYTPEEIEAIRGQV